MSFLKGLMKEAISNEAASLNIDELNAKLDSLKETKTALESFKEDTVLGNLAIENIAQSFGVKTKDEARGYINQEIEKTEKSIKLYNSVNK